MGKRLAWSESTWFQWMQLAAGLLLGALGYRMFLVPNDIAAGGFTGIGQLVNHFLSWPVGAVALALNVPLFALSMGRLGLKFGLKSLLASVALSLLIDHLPVGPFTRDPILAAIFGGVVAGGRVSGWCCWGGATTGGSDMLGKLVSSRVPVVTVGAVTFTVDVLVIACSAFVFDADKALLAMVSAFLMNRMLDGVLTGPSRAKAYYIHFPPQPAHRPAHHGGNGPGRHGAGRAGHVFSEGNDHPDVRYRAIGGPSIAPHRVPGGPGGLCHRHRRTRGPGRGIQPQQLMEGWKLWALPS